MDDAGLRQISQVFIMGREKFLARQVTGMALDLRVVILAER
jgi:hypothetical protein